MWSKYKIAVLQIIYQIKNLSKQSVMILQKLIYSFAAKEWETIKSENSLSIDLQNGFLVDNNLYFGKNQGQTQNEKKKDKFYLGIIVKLVCMFRAYMQV